MVHHETQVKHCEPHVKHREPLVKHHETLKCFNATISTLDVETLTLGTETSLKRRGDISIQMEFPVILAWSFRRLQCWYNSKDV